MLPSLKEGELLLCRAPGRAVNRGDIVVFRHPQRPSMSMVKRVVGLPREALFIEMGEVLINGTRGLDTWGSGFTYPDGEWQLEPDQVFVLSDNRSATRDDSRNFGPIPIVSVRCVWRRLRSRR